MLELNVKQSVLSSGVRKLKSTAYFSKIVSKRKSKFLMSYSVIDNALCSLFSANAVHELSVLKY